MRFFESSFKGRPLALLFFTLIGILTHSLLTKPTLESHTGAIIMELKTKHFNEKEFACKGCGDVRLDTELLAVLELVRQVTGKPVTITSGYRSPAHNKAVGGAPRSKHILGIAADITVEGYTPREVYDLLDKTFPNYYGIGLYSGWVHIDVRKTKARWHK